MDILNILSYSRSHGSIGESLFIYEYLQKTIVDLGYSYVIDPAGNHWVEVGKPKDYPYLFACHIDTVHKADGTVLTTNYTANGRQYIGLANKRMGCLGADDGVGIYLSLKMMAAGVKGTYVFIRGEEKGLIGAEYISTHMKEKLSQFLMCIEVDRQGTDEIIIEQAMGKCASTEFAEALANSLDMGHRVSYNGIYTDNSLFTGYIPECVNIAAGYDRQHTDKERLDMTYLNKLAEAIVKVEWGKLPIKRQTWDYGDLYETKYSLSLGTGTDDHQYEGYMSYRKNPEYQELDDYVWQKAGRVVEYLYDLGVTVADIEAHFSDDIPF